MDRSRLSFVVVFACLSLPVRAADTTGIYGFYDPATGVFTPAAPAVGEAGVDAAAVRVVRKGTLVVSIQLDARKLPADQTVGATVSATAADGTYRNRVSNFAAVVRDGDRASVVVTMRYAFTVESAATPLIVDVTLTANRTPYGVADHTRTIALPADGATTRVAFSSIL
ncbi:hypothetical protein OHA_1_00803 [Pleomorphomonas sp. SM30]|uniref:Uncharacterized protein n=1 Tax=Oharaeibacter diazotrophicus TaxID=1920512 RepID=A0A4R6RK38_9HYPH|nr:hypothetical protein EDD54_0708 [Oharaeibacter diazotrophicus]BBE71233.1 hypothetical protein OHA_1_00803 [Pleomorphomonas sp. SM30]